MSHPKLRLKTLEGRERECVPGLAGCSGRRPRGGALLPSGHDGLAPRLRPLCVAPPGDRGTEALGWEMWVRMAKILCSVLREAHERQIGETMDALSDGPERFYKHHLDR